jgi:carbonic anhydrase/acetyltransferase-like protein (isoleucine patch superfamily)
MNRNHVNDNSKPLIFLGSNYAMLIIKEVCDEVGITVQGIIDSDYFGNTDTICGMPVIDSEECFNDPAKLSFYQQHFNFFCATNWSPEHNAVQQRNRDKRHQLIDLIDSLQLPCISLIDPRANVSRYATVGKGVFVDAMCNVEAGAQLHDYVNIMWACGIGHDTVVERNCTLQRQCWTGGNCYFEHDTFLGIGVRALKTGAIFGARTWIQELVYIKRGTVADEIVGLEGKNQRRVVVQQSIG